MKGNNSRITNIDFREGQIIHIDFSSLTDLPALPVKPLRKKKKRKWEKEGIQLAQCSTAHQCRAGILSAVMLSTS